MINRNILNSNFGEEKIIPSSFGDSLSYYEEIARLVGLTGVIIDEINELGESNNKKVSHEELNNNYKLSKKADFTGSWHGIEHPVMSEPGIQGVVDKNVKDIKKLQTLGYVVTDFEALETALDEDPRVLLITENILVNKDIEVPKNFTLKFEDRGMFTISADKTVKLNCNIIADYKRIFAFENEGSKVISSKIHEGETNAQYDVKVDWFGADPNCYISKDNEYLPMGHVYGDDSTDAFKRAMKFCESGSNVFNGNNPRRNQSHITLTFKPNGNYYCMGHNPLGVQSSVPDIGYFINVEGNKACIYWKPLNEVDALFGKYGRIVSPSIIDLNVNLIGETNQRKGCFVQSKTGDGDRFHFWTQGVFKNLNLNVQYQQVGYYIVFDIASDNVHSHDDTSIIENVVGGCYKTFIRFANNEAVGWSIKKVLFHSYTEGATHIDISSGHSGGINVEACEILLASNDETFIKTGDNCSLTPYNISNSRIENRGDFRVRLAHVTSGIVNFSGLNILSGNDTPPNPQMSFVYVGRKGKVTFKQCELYPYMRMFVSKTESYTFTDSLIFDECSFYANNNGTPRTIAYPILSFINDVEVMGLDKVIRDGFRPRGIVVNNSRYSDGNAPLNIRYGGVYSSEKRKAILSKPSRDGFVKPNVSTSLPPNIVITSINVYYSGAILENADKLTVLLSKEESPDNVVFEHVLLTAPQYGTKLNGNNIVTLPSNQFNQIVAYFTKDGKSVTDTELMPNGYIEIEYKSISNRSDTTPFIGVTKSKDMLAFG